MTIEEDWEGKATLPVSADCAQDCEVRLKVEELDDAYDFRVEIRTPDVCQIEGGLYKAHYRCELNDDGDELDCGNFLDWEWDDYL